MVHYVCSNVRVNLRLDFQIEYTNDFTVLDSTSISYLFEVLLHPSGSNFPLLIKLCIKYLDSCIKTLVE